jgi:hypothetical protein
MESMLRFLADYWPWVALGYLGCFTCALALCRAAKRADEAWGRAQTPRQGAKQRSLPRPEPLKVRPVPLRRIFRPGLAGPRAR